MDHSDAPDLHDVHASLGERQKDLESVGSGTHQPMSVSGDDDGSSRHSESSEHRDTHQPLLKSSGATAAGFASSNLDKSAKSSSLDMNPTFRALRMRLDSMEYSDDLGNDPRAFPLVARLLVDVVKLSVRCQEAEDTAESERAIIRESLTSFSSQITKAHDDFAELAVERDALLSENEALRQEIIKLRESQSRRTVPVESGNELNSQEFRRSQSAASRRDDASRKLPEVLPSDDDGDDSNSSPKGDEALELARIDLVTQVEQLTHELTESAKSEKRALKKAIDAEAICQALEQALSDAKGELASRDQVIFELRSQLPKQAPSTSVDVAASTSASNQEDESLSQKLDATLAANRNLTHRTRIMESEINKMESHIAVIESENDRYVRDLQSFEVTVNRLNRAVLQLQAELAQRSREEEALQRVLLEIKERFQSRDDDLAIAKSNLLSSEKVRTHLQQLLSAANHELHELRNQLSTRGLEAFRTAGSRIGTFLPEVTSSAQSRSLFSWDKIDDEIPDSQRRSVELQRAIQANLEILRTFETASDRY